MLFLNGSQGVVRSLQGCEKWIPDNFLHRNRYSDFFPVLIFSMKKSILKMPIGENREDPKSSNGEHAHKSKVLELFSITTRFKICIFSIFALIARCSKYDFWIPDNILALEKKSE